MFVFSKINEKHKQNFSIVKQVKKQVKANLQQ